jgi:hypothetical protein
MADNDKQNKQGQMGQQDRGNQPQQQPKQGQAPGRAWPGSEKPNQPHQQPMGGDDDRSRQGDQGHQASKKP